MRRFCFPMTILILTGFMNGIPTELEEAMVIDGANIYQVFFKMILPLSVPGLVSVSIFNFIQVWNNLLFPLIFISDKDKGTISMGLLAFFGEYSTDYSSSMAGICSYNHSGNYCVYFLPGKNREWFNERSC